MQLKDGLEEGFIPAWERLSGIVRLEVGGRVNPVKIKTCIKYFGNFILVRFQYIFSHTLSNYYYDK